MKWIALFILIFIITSCGFKVSSLGSKKSSILSGSIVPFSGLISSNSPSSFLLAEANAIACADPVYAKLFLVKSDGTIDDSLPIATQLISSNAMYSFDVKSLGLAENPNVQYLIKAEGCNNNIYKRPVTNFDDTQNIDARTTVVSEVVNAHSLITTTLDKASRKDVQDLINTMTGTSLPAALNSLTNQAIPSSQFTSIFGASPSVVQDAKPDIQLVSPASLINELAISNFSVNAFHIDPGYSFAYSWKVDGVVKSTAASFNYIPGANTSGFHNITLYVGKDDGTGHIDLGKPYYTKNLSITVNNSILPVSPNISLHTSNPSPVNVTTVQVNLTTGVGLINCDSFSHMAITDTSTAPGVSQFYIDCTDSGTQIELVTFSSSDGAKTLYLWTIDNEGNISSAKTTSLILDTLPPTASLSFSPVLIKGGNNQTINLSGADAGVGLSSLVLYFSDTGAAPYAPLSSLNLNSTSYSWSVPPIDTTNGKLKLVATDLTGLDTIIYSGMFDIDSTAPSAPSISRTSSLDSNSTTVTISTTCTAEYNKIIYSESSFTPALSDAAWENCATIKNFTVSSTNGIKTIYAFSRDAAGNISTTSSSITMKLDTALPLLNITNPSVMKGNSSTGTVTWSLTEENVAAAATFSVEIFDGTSWLALGTPSASAGMNSNQSYTLNNFFVPNVNSTNSKIRISLTDAAGNMTTAESSAFVIDHTAPVLSSVIINDGEVYAGTASVNLKIALTDNFSGQLSIRMGNANASTQDCQSEYSDTSWMTWDNGTASFPFDLTPTDGTKKICVWAKDAVGNITVMSPTSGTSDIDFDSIQYSTGNPPKFTSFTLAKTSGSGRTAPLGEPMTITWSIEDVEGLNNAPISFAYTTNNTTWLDLTTNLTIAIPSNITWTGSLSGNPASASGTVTTWTAPSSSYFRIRAIARDMAKNTSLVSLSEPFNTGSWNIYAGSKDRGDGGIGRTAALTGAGSYTQFAINPKNGDIYAVDNGYGIRKLDAKTGIVSTFIKHGTLNLPTNGPLPATPLADASAYTNLTFDNSGKLYLGQAFAASYTATTIYQINLETSAVRLYAGGGVSDDGGAAATSLHVIQSGFNFDEQNSLYVWTYCGGAHVSTLNYQATGKRIVKIAQNSDGTPGTTTRVIGDCTFGSVASGGTAISQPALSSTATYPQFSGIVPWDNGNKIMILGYNGVGKYKIINGITYPTNVGTYSSVGVGIYNHADGYFYKVNSTGVEKVLINTAGANGDVATQFFTSNSTSAGCTADGTTTTTFCGLLLTQFQVRTGTLYFADGSGLNNTSTYSIRYFDGENKLRTAFGTKPFYGDGLNKSLMRGSISGLYYKKATEANQVTFPEGLYFSESAGLVFGYISPTTGIVSQLLGNQARIAVNPVTGTTISKNMSMGNSYVANGMPLSFDDNGLPWLRMTNDAISIDADKKIIRRTNSSANSHLQNAPDGANPTGYSLFVYGGSQNFAMKNDGLFMISNYFSTGFDPIISIRYMDFTNLVTPIILGGSFKASDNKTASPDIATPGAVTAAPLWTNCRNGAACYVQYNPHNDNLYFAEGVRIRFITTPDVPATSTLGTLFTIGSSTIANFSFTPDGSQLWYFKASGGLYCYDISSGKSWCDNTSDHFLIRTAAGFVVSPGPNQITFKDDQTMYVSTYGGEILQFDLPTGP